MKICRAGGWLLSACLLAGIASCDGSEDVSELTAFNRPEAAAPGAGAQTGASRCVPGQTLACLGVCSAFGLGYQVCADDGLSYGQCICPPPSPLRAPGTGGDPVVIPPRGSEGPPVVAGLPGNEGVPPVAPRIGIVGAECTRDTDCGGGLTCSEAGTDSIGVGGPAGGYCSRTCNDSADCTVIDPAATCGALGGRPMCLRQCASLTPPDGSSKCLDRPDLACVSAAALGEEEPTGEPQLGICVPRCQSDAQCGGRRCDLSNGLCTDEPRPGDPIGAACSEPETCAAGLCLGATDERSGLCSAFCTLGVPGCGFDGSESTIGAACLLAQVPGEGDGDSGLCFALCEVDADCNGEGFICVPEATSPRGGVCLPETAVPAQPEPNEPEPGEPYTGVGAACAGDDDCSSGLSCLTADSDPFGIPGGPAQGYCSVPCENAVECPSTDTLCASTAGGGYCLEECDLEDVNACHGRETTVCISIGGPSVCVPTCTADTDCGGRTCDVENGLCVDVPVEPTACTSDEDCEQGVCDVAAGVCVAEVPSGCASDDDCQQGVCEVETGECVAASGPCTSDADCAEGQGCDLFLGECLSLSSGCQLDTDCPGQVCDLVNGTCLDLPPTPVGAACSADTDCLGEASAADDTRLCLTVDDSNFCSAACVWGTPVGCEAYGTDAFCILPVDGDLGACLELCNTPDECEQQGYECVDIGTTVNGRSGACLPPLPEAPPASAADAGL